MADSDSAATTSSTTTGSTTTSSTSIGTTTGGAREQRFWINTVSLEHVQLGVAGGFVQADHGKTTRLRWLRTRDWIAMYSPRTGMRAGAPVQAFTALGRVVDAAPFQVRLSADVEPWRRAVDWQPCLPADVHPLLPDLTFVVDKIQWGFPFRRGLFRVDADDFARIARAMNGDWTAGLDPGGPDPARRDVVVPT